MLSILIPTYNTLCLELVRQLHDEAITLHIPFEIVVADDASDSEISSQNSLISQWKHCRYLALSHNIGPARIRNYLADHAQYDNLLFLDADTLPGSAHFLKNYLQEIVPGTVVCGGFHYQRKKPDPRCALRYYYGIHTEEKSVEERSKQPYACFIGMSFLTDKEVFKRVRFDEQMHFGYEDAYFGYLLQQAHIPIKYIDNPVVHMHTDTSKEYLIKIRNSIHNLSCHIDKQQEHIRLLHWYGKLVRYNLTGFVARLFQLSRKQLEANLTSAHPSLNLFAFYKLGYLCLIRQQKR